MRQRKKPNKCSALHYIEIVLLGALQQLYICPITKQDSTNLQIMYKHQTLLRFPHPPHGLRHRQPRGVRGPPRPLEQVTALGPPRHRPGQSRPQHGEEPRR